MTKEPKAARGRKAWSPADEEQIGLLAAAGLSGREAGSVLGRSEAAIRAKAFELGVSFDSAPGNALRRLLDGGAPILREDHGGGVGVRWCTASRSGETFDGAFCEKLVELKRLVLSDHVGLYVLARTD